MVTYESFFNHFFPIYLTHALFYIYIGIFFNDIRLDAHMAKVLTLYTNKIFRP